MGQPRRTDGSGRPSWFARFPRRSKILLDCAFPGRHVLRMDAVSISSFDGQSACNSSQFVIQVRKQCMAPGLPYYGSTAYRTGQLILNHDWEIGLLLSCN